MTDTHTPLPWHRGSTQHTELVMGFSSDSECVIAELDTDDVPMEETEANVELIIRSVNALPELVKALEWYAQDYNHELGCSQWDGGAKARAALAKVRP